MFGSGGDVEAEQTGFGRFTGDDCRRADAGSVSVLYGTGRYWWWRGRDCGFGLAESAQCSAEAAEVMGVKSICRGFRLAAWGCGVTVAAGSSADGRDVDLSSADR